MSEHGSLPPSPRSYGERVGVRGSNLELGTRKIPSPASHLAMRRDLSPQAGRGKKEKSS